MKFCRRKAEYDHTSFRSVPLGRFAISLRKLVYRRSVTVLNYVFKREMNTALATSPPCVNAPNVTVIVLLPPSSFPRPACPQPPTSSLADTTGRSVCFCGLQLVEGTTHIDFVNSENGTAYLALVWRRLLLPHSRCVGLL